MSYLAVEELKNNVPVSQKIRLDKSINIEIIRLGIYKSGILTDGLLNLQVYQDTELAGSVSIPFSELNQIGTNFHGMVAFYFDNLLAIRKKSSEESTELEFVITLTDNTDTITSIGLVRNQSPSIPLYNTELSPFPEIPSLAIWSNPFNMEIYTV